MSSQKHVFFQSKLKGRAPNLEVKVRKKRYLVGPATSAVSLFCLPTQEEVAYQRQWKETGRTPLWSPELRVLVKYEFPRDFSTPPPAESSGSAPVAIITTPEVGGSTPALHTLPPLSYYAILAGPTRSKSSRLSSLSPARIMPSLSKFLRQESIPQPTSPKSSSLLPAITVSSPPGSPREASPPDVSAPLQASDRSSTLSPAQTIPSLADFLRQGAPSSSSGVIRPPRSLTSIAVSSRHNIPAPEPEHVYRYVGDELLPAPFPHLNLPYSHDSKSWRRRFCQVICGYKCTIPSEGAAECNYQTHKTPNLQR